MKIFSIKILSPYDRLVNFLKCLSDVPTLAKEEKIMANSKAGREVREVSSLCRKTLKTIKGDEFKRV